MNAIPIQAICCPTFIFCSAACFIVHAFSPYTFCRTIYQQRCIQFTELFYTGNMPIVLMTALISNIYFLSQTASINDPNNVFVKMLG